MISKLSRSLENAFFWCFRKLDLRIKDRLMFMAVVPSLLILLIICFAFFIYSICHSNVHFGERIERITAIIGARGKSDLLFNNANIIQNALNIISHEHIVLCARIRTQDEDVFADYVRDKEFDKECSGFNESDGGFFKNRFFTTVPIRIDGKSFGYVELLNDTSEVKLEYLIYSCLVLLVFLIFLCFIYLSARIFCKLFAKPVHELKDLAQCISDRNYSHVKTCRAESDDIDFIIFAFDVLDKRLKIVEGQLSEARNLLEVEVNRLTQDCSHEKKRSGFYNASRADFLANMSHEIRTPLHGVLTYSAFGLRTGADAATMEKMREYFGEISDCGHNLLNLLGDILDLSKLASGKTSYHFLKTDLASPADIVYREFVPRFQDKEISFELDIRTGDRILICDSIKVAQVIRNLISNAYKFTKVGGKVFLIIEDDLLIRKKGIHVIQPAVSIRVSDNGVGIPKDQFDEVFEKFVQSRLTDDKSGGSGLGLSICQEIVSNHGGRMFLHSVEGEGSTFTFTLPRRECEASVDIDLPGFFGDEDEENDERGDSYE